MRATPINSNLKMYLFAFIVVYLMPYSQIQARKTYTEFREIYVWKRTKKEKNRKVPYTYLKRKSYVWKDHGRIIGLIKHPPKKFKIKIFAIGDTKPLRVEEHIGSLSVYETHWLRPGRYTIVFSAPGYTNCKIERVKVKKFSDVLLNIEFGTKVYQRYLN